LFTIVNYCKQIKTLLLGTKKVQAKKDSHTTTPYANFSREFRSLFSTSRRSLEVTWLFHHSHPFERTYVQEIRDSEFDENPKPEAMKGGLHESAGRTFSESDCGDVTERNEPRIRIAIQQPQHFWIQIEGLVNPCTHVH